MRTASDPLSILYRLQGRLNDSKSLAIGAYELKVKSVGNPAYLASGASKISYILQDCAEFSESTEWAMQGAALAHDKNTSTYFRTSFLICAARNMLAIGNLDKVLEFVNICQEINATHNEHHYEEEIQVLFCHLAALRHDWPVALEHALKTLEFSQVQFKPDFNFQASHRAKLMALLHGGQAVAVRADLEKRKQAIKDRQRLLMGQLHAEMLLDVFEQRFNSALKKAQDALEIAIQVGLRNDQWHLAADIGHIHRCLENQAAAREAEARATHTRNEIAAQMPDETMRNTYLAFTQKQIDLPLWEW